MGEAEGDKQLHDISDLLAHLEVDSLEAASELISEETDPDAFILEENGGFVIQMSTWGRFLEFPISVADFWELVHELEDEVASALEAEWEQESVADPGSESPG